MITRFDQWAFHPKEVISRRRGGGLDHEGFDRVVHPIPPTATAMATCGIGADVTPFTAITDIAGTSRSRRSAARSCRNDSVIDFDA
ncbi:hypothetical protein GCM10010172_39540 [Paractinoplanes ferrugineus]|uniref:Uncharacterized protein n=1 Tax=Paractinoplanes ferrugineus TaxID=113564 RepID=A0A919J0Y9_9ACTN|nr:hypothetical protein [Actinoplanes ferrugineus]GIE12731.1 hypothetical protein Afe05nite_45710 [Actinoplanes ferrugineus]